ncbi:hypothetical protein ES703_89692 [subsurface metagenome]
MMTTQAIVTRVARDMVGCRDPLPLFVALHSIPHLDNLTGNLMTQHQGCTVKAIPFHDIAATDATGEDTHQ